LKKIVASVILVILVISAFAALSAPNAKAQTTDAAILSYKWYTSPTNTVLAGYIGDLVVVGEVENTGTTTLGTIYIYGEALNSSGNVLNEVDYPVLAVPLLPGYKAPFYADFNPVQSVTQDNSYTSSVTNVTLRVSIADATNQTVYQNLSTNSLSGFDNSGVYTVTGNVINNGSLTADNVWVATTFYDASEKVIGMNYTGYLSTALAPDSEVPFIASPTDNSASLSNDVKSYAVLVEYVSTSPPPTSHTGSPTPTPNNSPSSSSKPKQTPTPVNSLVTYGAVSAVVVIVVVLAVLMLLRTRRKKGQAEQPLPPPPPPPPPP
jgi:hypothetical protein